MTYSTLLTSALITVLTTACGSTQTGDTSATHTSATQTPPAADGLLDALPDLEVREVELDEGNETRRVIAASVAGPSQRVGLFFLREAGQWQLRGRTELVSEHPYAAHLRRFLDSEEEDDVAMLHTMVRVNRNLGQIDASVVIGTLIEGDEARVDVSFSSEPTLGDDPMTVTGSATRIDGVWQRLSATYPVSRSMHRQLGSSAPSVETAAPE